MVKTRKNEETEPKQKQQPVVDVTGDGSKVWCYKEQYCTGTWNVRSMNQGKLEVVQQEMARVDINILLTVPKPLTVWITANCGKFFKRWEHQTTLPAYWEICMQVKKQQLEPDMEQQTGSKLGKEYVKAVYCHPAYLTYMQSTSCNVQHAMLDEAQAGIKTAGRNNNLI